MEIWARWKPGRNPERLLRALRRMFPKFELYAISTPGIYDPQYIVKARGRYGDVIVQWKTPAR